jgi:hypothetical protein
MAALQCTSGPVLRSGRSRSLRRTPRRTTQDTPGAANAGLSRLPSAASLSPIARSGTCSAGSERPGRSRSHRRRARTSGSTKNGEPVLAEFLLMPTARLDEDEPSRRRPETTASTRELGSLATRLRELRARTPGAASTNTATAARPPRDAALWRRRPDAAPTVSHELPSSKHMSSSVGGTGRTAASGVEEPPGRCGGRWQPRRPLCAYTSSGDAVAALMHEE